MTTMELSPRELDVVQLLCRSQTRPQIGTALGISENTVRTHIQNTLKKLGMHSKDQVIAWGFRNGYGSDGQEEGKASELEAVKSRSIELGAAFARVAVTGVAEGLPPELLKIVLFDDIPGLVRWVEQGFTARSLIQRALLRLGREGVVPDEAYATLTEACRLLEGNHD